MNWNIERRATNLITPVFTLPFVTVVWSESTYDTGGSEVNFFRELVKFMNEWSSAKF
jgi:hypothetical protein